MRAFEYITSPVKLLTPEIVQMVGSIHEHKGKQELTQYYFTAMSVYNKRGCREIPIFGT